ncbi:two-component system phosphate regulon sensor histidine kinase PhoR [Pseudaminobacter salicylatoxidans]|uniref:histidine kinase n=1 Tax=Pseudaminobacter salicylatoxidans TaxID=93369 RepID=A0A316C278_PSESE|nr:ATP-binding protein [Pseudaminobacter salicylatoxidans]PWJ81634.1 two-component system phosphate regulon sensor histidine kinase PhoR [Pseudaminobacter salicylatoxidans]
MSEKGSGRDRLFRLLVHRFRQNRWMLAAALAVAIAVHLTAPSGAWLVAGVLALFVVAALAPSRTADQRRVEAAEVANGAGLAGLSSENLAAAVTDPLIVFDGAGAVVHANAAASAAFGALSPGILLLLKFRAPEMQETIQAVLFGRETARETDYVERVPIERVYRVTASAVGRNTGLYVMVFKDQSEARRIDRMRADFIANASHELRTPLASVSGFIETLRGPARDDVAAREQFLQIMQAQTARMARLIDDLLSLSRLEMKPYFRTGAKVELKDVLDSVIASLAPLAADSEVVIERDFSDTASAVFGDRDELIQVFENLVENACKYGQKGGRVVVSVAGPEADPEGETTVTVRDFGPGIPEEHIPRVTERFYRIDAETSRAQKGTGLGLAIVKHILTRHKAWLSISSKLGEGAAFTVHFPPE